MKNYIYKTYSLIFICVFLLLNINTTLVSATPPVLNAEGVILIDGITGDILFEKNSTVQYEPASTTKVMTALIVLENCNLDDKVTIGEHPQYVDGSALGIREGEVYTIEELLYGLLLESANDVAEALAEHITGLTIPEGSNAVFGEMMTARAKSIGANNTVFKNPSGLTEEGHLTTAYDLALIMKEAFKNEDFIKISQTESHFYENHPFSDGSEKWATNRNNCLMNWYPYYYENLYTGKTGYTPEANHTYTAVAKKDDQYLVAAFLNAVDKNAHYYSVGDLFDWGFENFYTKKIVSKGDELSTLSIDEHTDIPLISSKDVYYTFSSSDNSDINTSVAYTYKDLSESSIEKNEVLFDSKLLINGEEYTSIDLSSGIDREYIPPTKMESLIDKILEHKFIIIFTVILFILLIFTLQIIRSHNIRKRRARKRRRTIRSKYNF